MPHCTSLHAYEQLTHLSAWIKARIINLAINSIFSNMHIKHIK